ncbi:MAG: hypothetical protein ACTSUE_04115, partial [Promethearchaeota archaeon]
MRRRARKSILPSDDETFYEQQQYSIISFVQHHFCFCIFIFGTFAAIILLLLMPRIRSPYTEVMDHHHHHYNNNNNNNNNN